MLTAVLYLFCRSDRETSRLARRVQLPFAPSPGLMLDGLKIVEANWIYNSNLFEVTLESRDFGADEAALEAGLWELRAKGWRVLNPTADRPEAEPDVTSG